jgi:hypothetical protein
MNKVSTLIFCLALMPTLFAQPSKDVVSKKPYDPDSRINPHPSTEPVHIDDGRALGDILMTIDLTAIGMPGDGNDNAGLTWDGTYLYLVNMYDNNLYVIDPTGPVIVYNLPLRPSSWGLGHEQNPWANENITGYCYEIGGSGEFLGLAQFMADMSENWQDGEIWILSVGGTNRAYKFSVPDGTLLDDIGDPIWTYTSQRGLTYDPWNDKFWVGGWNSNMVWEINTDGTPTGRQFSFNNVASLAYDYQSTIHPEPVLWIATNEASNYIYMVDPDNPQPATTLLWDFEDGLQGWTHTNGQSFPAAWGVEASDYQPAWQIPSSGDSSMWIDSDAAGSGTWVQDTALSPVFIPGATMDWLKYGFTYNDEGISNQVIVGIKYYDGATWTAVPLKTYTADTISECDSVDVSAYNGYNLIQIYFYYDDNNTWAWYAGFDNVSIDAIIGVHDVGCAGIISPPEGSVPPGDYDIIARIRNYGHFIETFDITANVYDTTDSWNLIFNGTVTLIDFPVGGDTNVNFGIVTFEQDKAYYIEVYTQLIGDENPGNDTCTSHSNTMTYDGAWNFETGWQGWTHTNGQAFPAGWDVMPSNYQGASWQIPSSGDSCMWIDSDANGSGSILTADTALSPVIVPSFAISLEYGVSYNWIASGEWLEVGIKYYDGATWTVVPLMVYTADVAPTWETIDISAYNTYDSMQVYFYYNDNYIWAWYAAFDNVMIWTAIAEQPEIGKPIKFGFTPDMPTVTKHPTIVYTTTIPGKVYLKIYDNTGRLIKTLVNRQNESAGTKTVFWDGKDDNLRSVANGIYFLRLDTAEKSATQKLILIK